MYKILPPDILLGVFSNRLSLDAVRKTPEGYYGNNAFRMKYAFYFYSGC